MNFLNLTVSEFQDLNDFPLRLSTLLSGNDSRVYHLFLYDVTRDYTDKTTSRKLIESYIKKTSGANRKKKLAMIFDNRV